ncbi:Abscisic acid-insensitive 5-like protein 2 [Quillaja saponaria]|uniref:Abscisic acid-insensitive 5-like protein 2 n=1 Tax=Quillaja saponaria TaxID=32244 RepID=A0AAD7PKK3_QUISA|nr:Abscisic acid-insensitive 5-like protein 2 [Quillaja saponaria]
MDNRTMVSPNRAEGKQFPPLQGSLYDLTFDEVQSQLGNTGKPLYSMNLDELLKNVISEPNPSASSSASFLLGNLNLNGTLSKKTVDEVWQEIINHGHVNTMDNQLVQQQLDLGETTLEEFLVRAGIINLGNQDGVIDNQPIMSIDPMVVVSQQTDWLPLQMATIQQQQQQQMTALSSDFNVSESVYENSVVGIGYSENPLAISMPMSAMSSTSSDSQAAAERKHRYSDEMTEKTIERRQKRMIKNRESAARSRARKQAYTNELEHEVLRLRKINNWLKKQKEVETLLSSAPIPVPKYQLRRSSSAFF